MRDGVAFRTRGGGILERGGGVVEREARGAEGLGVEAENTGGAEAAEEAAVLYVVEEGA